MLQMIIITNCGILQNNHVFISYSTNIIVIFAKQLLKIRKYIRFGSTLCAVSGNVIT